VTSLALSNPSTLPQRKDTLAVEHLPIQPGYACRQCDLRTTSHQIVTKHLRRHE